MPLDQKPYKNRLQLSLFLFYYFPSQFIYNFLFIHLFSTNKLFAWDSFCQIVQSTNTNKTHHVWIIMSLFLSNSLSFMFYWFCLNFWLYSYFILFVSLWISPFQIKLTVLETTIFYKSKTHIENTNWDLLNDSVYILFFWREKLFLHIQEYGV